MVSWDEELVKKASLLLDAEHHLMDSLKALRTKRGISQEVVAKRMGVTQPAVAAFEHYDANPRMSSIRRYALAVGAQLTIEVAETDIDPKYDEGGSSLPTETNPPAKD
jgi:transcriptional regulator with XRE-family HTH domain